MTHKHHPKEARFRTVRQQDGGWPAFDISKDMNISPDALGRGEDAEAREPDRAPGADRGRQRLVLDRPLA
jgi:hypothetical protein